jgi:hypothetical protein
MEGNTRTWPVGFIDSREKISCFCEAPKGPTQLLSSSENIATIEPRAFVRGRSFSVEDESFVSTLLWKKIGSIIIATSAHHPKLEPGRSPAQSFGGNPPLHLAGRSPKSIDIDRIN